MANPITVKIIGDATQFTNSLEKAAKSLQTFNVGGLFALGGVAGAAATVVKGLFDIGASVDAAFDHLQVATGASGDALAGLEDTVNQIARTVPASFGDIATAVGEIAVKLDLTGAPLEALSTQLLNLSRITGTDVATNVNTVTSLFNNWGIATEDPTAKLDELFRASQATGVSVTELSQTLAQNGAILRQAGYGFESAIALVASLGKQGVNAQTVITGLRTAISNAAQENVKASQAQARAAQASADRAVAAADRRKAAEERLSQIMKDNARQAEAAAKALKDATENQAEVEADAAKDVARAKEDAAKLIADVQGPVNDGMVATADYQKRLADAQQAAARKIADAEDSAAKRRNDAAKRVADSQDRVAQAAEDAKDRVDTANRQAADANEKASRRVQVASAATANALSADGQTSEAAVDQVIKKIMELGPGAEAQGLALQAFGARAGPQLYDALMRGKTGVDALTDTIRNGSSTINGAAKDTEDFAESWTRLKNNLVTSFEPAAMAVFDGISSAIENIVNYFPVGVQVIKGAFQDLWRTLAGAPGWFGNLIGGFVQNIGLPHFAAGGSMMASGWATINERSLNSENVWLPQGAKVQPSWAGGGRGGDTYNINGSNLSAGEVAREIAWQRRVGNGR